MTGAPSFPWPTDIHGARLVLGPFDPCGRCGTGSWVRYGDTVLCLACAKRAAIPGEVIL